MYYKFLLFFLDISPPPPSLVFSIFSLYIFFASNFRHRFCVKPGFPFLFIHTQSRDAFSRNITKLSNEEEYYTYVDLVSLQ